MNTPIESLEAYLPMRFLSYGLRPDTGGAGEYRGGCGIERSWMLTAPRATLSILAERTKINPWGLNGGGPGALGEYVIIKRNGEVLKLPSKCTVLMEEGDSLIVHTPGGGGFGAPKKRAPERINRDVANGLVSAEAALRIYGVKTLN
jgi:N-methylhydantoinase B